MRPFLAVTDVDPEGENPAQQVFDVLDLARASVLERAAAGDGGLEKLIVCWHAEETMGA